MNSLPLSQQKRRLVAQSDAIRREISSHLDRIEESFGWVDRLLGAGRAMQKGGSLLAGAAGLLAAWKLSRRGKKAATEAVAPPAEPPGLLTRLIEGGMKAAGLIGPIVGLVGRMRG